VGIGGMVVTSDPDNARIDVMKPPESPAFRAPEFVLDGWTFLDASQTYGDIELRRRQAREPRLIRLFTRVSSLRYLETRVA